MAGGIDEIDLVLSPIEADGCRSDGDASFAFLFHVIHGGGAFVNIAGGRKGSCVVKHSLGGCGFACIDMCDNTDISDFLDFIDGFGGENGFGNGLAEPSLSFEFDFLPD